MAYEPRPLNDYFLLAPLLMDVAEVIEFAVPEPGYLVKVMTAIGSTVPGSNVVYSCSIDGVAQAKGDHTVLVASEAIGQVDETEVEEGPVEDQDVYVNTRLMFTGDAAGAAGSNAFLLAIIRRDGGSDV